MDHPRRAGPSIGGGADYDVTLLSCLPDDGWRRRIVAAGVEVDFDVFEPLLKHLAGALEGDIAAMCAAPDEADGCVVERLRSFVDLCEEFMRPRCCATGLRTSSKCICSRLLRKDNSSVLALILHGTGFGDIKSAI